MGRRKIAIEPLTDERNRSVTFLKRKAGLFKKAHELSVLCQIDIAVIIFGRNKKLYEFSSCDTSELIRNYELAQPHESKGPRDFDAARRKKPATARAGRQADHTASVTDDEGDDDDDEFGDDDDQIKSETEEPPVPAAPQTLRARPGRSRTTRAATRTSARRTTPSKEMPNPPLAATPNGPPLAVYHRATSSVTSIASSDSYGGPHLRTVQQQGYDYSQGSPRTTVTHPGPNQHNLQPVMPYTGPGRRGHQRSVSSITDVSPSVTHLLPAHPQGAEYGMQGGSPADGFRQSSEWAMFGVVPQRPQSVDIGATERRYAQGPPQRQMTMGPVGTPNMGSMRPKLKVQIPMGDSAESQISSSEPSRDTADRQDDSRTDSGGRRLNGPRAASHGPPERSGDSTESGASTNDQPSSVAGSVPTISGTSGPHSAGPHSGGPWGASLLLPPPSPSSYINNSGSATTGPGNPFGRPALTSNGEQTPLSAALPSKYVNDLLPSPSNFYGTEWNSFGPPSAMGFGPPSAFPQQHPHVLQQQQMQQQPVGMGISIGSIGTRNAHLSADMLPSPLQFNWPSTSPAQASPEVRGDKKREPGGDVAGTSKRLKVEGNP